MDMSGFELKPLCAPKSVLDCHFDPNKVTSWQILKGRQVVQGEEVPVSSVKKFMRRMDVGDVLVAWQDGDVYVGTLQQLTELSPLSVGLV